MINTPYTTFINETTDEIWIGFQVTDKIKQEDIQKLFPYWNKRLDENHYFESVTTHTRGDVGQSVGFYEVRWGHRDRQHVALPGQWIIRRADNMQGQTFLILNKESLIPGYRVATEGEIPVAYMNVDNTGTKYLYDNKDQCHDIRDGDPLFGEIAVPLYRKPQLTKQHQKLKHIVNTLQAEIQNLIQLCIEINGCAPDENHPALQYKLQPYITCTQCSKPIPAEHVNNPDEDYTCHECTTPTERPTDWINKYIRPHNQ